MSLHLGPIPDVPAETRRIAQAAFPKGNRWVSLRDELGTVYTDEDFADLFPERGQPAAAPWRLALASVMQYAEGLSDQQAENALRSRIDWKYALGWPLEHPGFDASVLSEFRTRLLGGGAEVRLLDRLLTKCQEQQWIKERGKQRTDSTHVWATIRQLNRLENVGETMRNTLNVLAVVAPDWLRAQAPPEWVERYKDRMDDYRLPKGESPRLALAEAIGRDGEGLLAAVYAEDALPWLRQLPAVSTLRQVWIQQYVPTAAGPLWRRSEAHGLSSAPVGIRSPHDAQARYSEKRESHWIGYKVHLTETCDEELPHLITQVETTIAPVPDSEALPKIQQDLAQRALLPAQQIADAGYVTARLLVSSQQQQQVELCGPPRADSAWQARAKAGFAAADFSFDWEQRQATCPRGQASSSWQETTDRYGKGQVKIKFAVTTCRPCAQRAQCTKIERRLLTIQPQAETQALALARQREQTKEYTKLYAQRAGIEGTISQGVRRCGLHTARYVGLAKTHLQHLLSAAAINLVRLGNWLADIPLAKTRQTAFVKLMRAEPLPC
jgi:transposase